MLWNRELGRCEDTCSLEPELASGEKTVDCGVLQVDADPSARLASQRCVLDVLASKRPFKLVHRLEGGDAEAYTSFGASAFISVYRYDSPNSAALGSAGEQATLSELRCQSLVLRPDCEASDQTLCLDCVGEFESSLVCGTQRADGECRGAGNYEAGKEGGYRPCCPGLREVFQKRASYVGEGAVRTCVDLPLRIYACVEGRCGDGRCEEAEAVPCGCALDCPSAALGSADAGPSGPEPPLPAATKGYELYAWNDGAVLRFMLITGTNREKTLDEILVESSSVENDGWVAISGTGLDRLEQLLTRVPPGASVLLGRLNGLPPLSAESRAAIERALALVKAPGFATCEGVATNPDLTELRAALPLPAHRDVPVACDRTRPCNHVRMGTPSAVVCRSHSDCTEGDNGRCQPYGYACTYDACFTDTDCRPDQLCDCAGGSDGAHQCIPARCRTDADCPGGRWCSPSRSVVCFNLERVSEYYCHTPEDECTTDVDCPRGACVFDPNRSLWRCTDESCTVP